MKRKKKGQGRVEANDETENDAPEDEVEGGGSACRQKGWWKRGDVETKLNTVNMTAWVHKECNGIEEEVTSGSNWHVPVWTAAGEIWLQG